MVILQMMEILSQTNSTLFFVNVGTVLVNSIACTDNIPVDYIQQDINTLYFDPVTENEICKIIGSLMSGTT